MPFVVMGICNPIAPNLLKEIEFACKRAWILMSNHLDSGGKLHAEDVGGLALISRRRGDDEHKGLVELGLHPAVSGSIVKLHFFYVTRGDAFNDAFGTALGGELNMMNGLPDLFFGEIATVPIASAHWLPNPVWTVREEKADNNFPYYLMVIDGIRKWMTLSDAAAIHDSGLQRVEIGGYVMESGMIEREMTIDDRRKIRGRSID